MIVEFDIDSDALSQVLERAPGTSLVIDHLDASRSIPLRALFWATGDDEVFEATLAEQPTITAFERLARENDASLYRVQYAEEVPEVEAHRASVALDGVVVHAENDGGGWFVRMRFPDREAVAAFCERCWEVGFDLRIRAVYDRREGTPEQRFGLTTAQYETLLTALRDGYFSIPRGSSLGEIADELDVSSQAASERLRRGMKTLVRATLADADEDRRTETSQPAEIEPE
jgi:hypothetical protein